MVIRNFNELGLVLPKGTKKTGSIKVTCPQCSHRRLKKDEACLSITFNQPNKYGTGHLFNCFHCKIRGICIEGDAVINNEDKLNFTPVRTHYEKPDIDLDDFELDKDVVEWFKKRAISTEVLNIFGIKGCLKRFEKDKAPEKAIMFPYFKNGELINIQYRNYGDKQTKCYRLVPKCQKVFFGLDNLVMDGYVMTDTIIITEGQIDAMSVVECGYFGISVPNGTPFEEAGKMPVKNPKMEYLDDPDAQFIFKKAGKVILLGDDDHQGRRLMEEIATRIGVEKCYRGRYPEGCKDANDVLRKYGKAKLVEVIETAPRMPVAGVVTISQIRDEIEQLFVSGPDPGLNTGFANLDKICRLALGRLYVITAPPEAGKSRIMWNIAVNMMDLHNAKVSAFTPESRPFANIVTKIAQIRTGKPFYGDDKMSKKEKDDALEWLDSRLTFNNSDDRTVQAITDIWKGQLSSDGVHYGILDPFNYLTRKSNQNELDFVLETLTFLSNWCVTNRFTVFIIAHPRKQLENKRGEYSVISPYEISGAAHWFNVPDFIWSLWRPRNDERMPVQLHIKKAKQEEVGTSGRLCLFNYDRVTGLYTPYDDVIYVPDGTKEGLPLYRPDDYGDDELDIDWSGEDQDEE